MTDKETFALLRDNGYNPLKVAKKVKNGIYIECGSDERVDLSSGVPVIVKVDNAVFEVLVCADGSIFDVPQ